MDLYPPLLLDNIGVAQEEVPIKANLGQRSKDKEIEREDPRGGGGSEHPPLIVEGTRTTYEGSRVSRNRWNTSHTWMGITCSPLSQNNGNLPLPFLVVITQFFSWMVFINNCICILTGLPG